MVAGGNEPIEREAEDGDGEPRFSACAPPTDDAIVVKAIG
jgi:hypothetical protein